LRIASSGESSFIHATRMGISQAGDGVIVRFDKRGLADTQGQADDADL